MATTRHTRSKPRRNPRRMTMAGVRAKSRAYARATYGHDGFFSAQNSRFFGPEKFDGPYSGPGGTFFTKTGRGGAGVYVVEDSGDVHTDWESDRRYPDMTRRLGVEVAKARAAGKPLTAAAVLRSAGVANASAVGARWLRMVQANIVEDMRSQKLPLLVHGWSDLERYTDPGRYLLTPTGEIPPGADEASDSSIELARRAITEEVDAWLQAEGHVHALKRLGKKAFRDNPRRRAPARRNRTQRPRPAQHRTRRGVRRCTH